MLPLRNENAFSWPLTLVHPRYNNIIISLIFPHNSHSGVASKQRAFLLSLNSDLLQLHARAGALSILIPGSKRIKSPVLGLALKKLLFSQINAIVATGITRNRKPASQSPSLSGLPNLGAPSYTNDGVVESIQRTENFS